LRLQVIAASRLRYAAADELRARAAGRGQWEIGTQARRVPMMTYLRPIVQSEALNITARRAASSGGDVSRIAEVSRIANVSRIAGRTSARRRR